MGNITLSNVSKSFGATTIIPDLDLDIENGEFVVFVGPSGCGKSTLLRLIAGLEDVSGGRISINGRDVTQEAPAKRGLAMVFQSYALYPHMTVRNNIAFPLKMAGEDKSVIDKKVTDAARVLNLTTIQPLDEAAVSAAAAETGRIVTAEEAIIHGGLGSAVAECVVQHRPVPMRILGVPHLAPTGSTSFLLDHFGLNAEGLMRAALDLVG